MLKKFYKQSAGTIGILDGYIFRSLSAATLFVTLVLAAIILLTQSLRFLELVLNANASAWSFWLLTFLTLPRFFEVILPLGLLAGILFIYNKLIMDSELIAMRALGFSPIRLARPALILATLCSVFLLFVTFWAAPKSHSEMQNLRQVIKTQYSTLMFRSGIFNKVGKGLMVYIRSRGDEQALRGLIIHDQRDPVKPPVTVVAKRGQVVATDSGAQVVVYEGSRQEYDVKNKVVNRLNFDRYTIDLPEEAGPVRKRWKEPDERSFFELFQPDMSNADDVRHIRRFGVEAQRRVLSPLLAPSFALVGLCFLLMGPIERRGQGRRILYAVSCVVLLQGLYLSAVNMAQDNLGGLVFLYSVVLGPLGVSGLLLWRASRAACGFILKPCAAANERERGD